MKEDKTTIVEKKNPYKYNGEILKSTQFSPQPKSLVNTDNQSVTKNKKFFIESYGCQMNMNDSEIVASILDKE